MNKQIIIILFYKYIEIENSQKFKSSHLKECINLKIRGRIVIAKEGINGSVSGSEEQVKKYKEILKSDSRFKDIRFKEVYSKNHPFNKMNIIIKKQIIPFNPKVDLKSIGKYIFPEELVKLYESEQEFYIIDVRNNYEFNVGRFKDSISLNINSFRQFPDEINKISHLKNKKIVTYCTGGIRCEKASAYLIENGFKDVSQLKDGILNFGEKFPDSYWEGKCFVFDKRLLQSINSKDNNIVECSLCGKSFDFYNDCKNPECNKFTALCTICFNNMSGCCSKYCLKGYVEFLMLKMNKA